MEASEEPQQGSDPAADGVPSDNTTLVAVLQELAGDGWQENMSVTPEGDVRCPRCRTESDPRGVALASIRRLEGASDPADMLAVLALTCPSCQAQGVVVANYGPESSEGDAILLRALEDAGS